MSHFNRHQRVSGAAYLTWAFLLLLVLSVVLIATIASGISLGQAWTLATTHQPERYSELYFADPGHLPTYAPASKEQIIYFYIVNHEHQSQLYTYQVMQTIGTATTVTEASVYVRDGQDAQQKVQFIIPKPLQQAIITVRLLHSNLQLSFRSQS